MNHASLFSGIGGFDLAAEWMGWNNVFNCEIEEFPRKVLKYHFPNAIQYHDIKRTDFTIHAGTIDVLSGGFPCQPFSVAGKRQGKNDERHLWPEMYRAIQEIRPRYIVGENVRGLLSWNDGMVLNEVYADLENEGYEVLTFVLPAASLNAPHKRDRVWVIASNTNSGRCRGFTEESRNNPSELSGGLVQGEQHHRNEVWSQTQRCGTATSNTNSARIQRLTTNAKPGSSIGQGWQGSQEIGDDGRFTYWQNFPTQSPVRSRDDGFPIGMDGITVSKWRKESIKAYGNAIVPQIAYRIFQSINLTNHG